MNDYSGVIIEESLADRSVLRRVMIDSTRVEEVTDEHATPWLSRWTLHSVIVPEIEAEALADEIKNSLDHAHSGAWYADFKNDTHHYIIYPDAIFCVDRSSRQQYEAATQHGVSLGIPAHQVDFDPYVEEWER